MHPKLISIGDFFLPTYGVLVALGIFAGLAVTNARAKQRGVDPEKTTNLVILSVLAGMLGAKIAMIIFDWNEFYSHDISQIFSLNTLQSAGVFQGGLIAGMLAAFWYLRSRHMPFLATADIFAPGIALAHGIGRLGCFAAGCCWGGHCDRPWAVTFTNPEASRLSGVPLNEPLHPTQLYEAFAEFLIFALLWQRGKRRRPDGTEIGLYLVLYSSVRFGVEFLRAHAQNLEAGLSLTQWMSLGFLGLGIWYLVRARPKSDYQPA